MYYGTFSTMKKTMWHLKYLKAYRTEKIKYIFFRIPLQFTSINNLLDVGSVFSDEFMNTSKVVRHVFAKTIMYLVKKYKEKKNKKNGKRNP